MGEDQPKQGERWTEHAVALLKRLGWQLSGVTQKDFECIKHSKDTHGLDAFMTYYDPFQNRKVGIILETKNYKWENVTRANVQKWVDEVRERIECAPENSDFKKKFNFDDSFVDTGLLMIWSKDEFHRQQFDKYLQELKIARKHRTLRIYVLHNDDILKLYSLSNLLEKISLAVSAQGKFEIIYPSFKNNDPKRISGFVILEYFKDPFFFARIIEQKTEGNFSFPKVTTAVFYFDKPSLESLNYMNMCLKRFQAKEEEVKVYYYGDPYEYDASIAEFKHRNGETRFKFEPIEAIGTVPWRID